MEVPSIPPSIATTRADTDVGVMALHAHDKVITPMLVHEGRWEPDEAAYLRATIQPGDTIIDVGANVGYFTLLAAAATGPGGRVVAVEPERANLALLAMNVWLNDARNVEIVPVAAGAHRDIVGLRAGDATNTGSFEAHAAWADDDPVAVCVALDEVLEGQRVDVVKVDVQGTDHEAIGGMRHAIGANPHARILTEFWLDGMASRHTDPMAVLASYRASGRPLRLLREGGALVDATDEEIIAACSAWEGRWVNLVLDAFSS